MQSGSSFRTLQKRNRSLDQSPLVVGRALDDLWLFGRGLIFAANKSLGLSSRRNGSDVSNERDGEAASLSNGAFDVDRSPEGRNEVFHDSEAQSCATRIGASCFFNAIESFEDSFMIFFRDSDPIIPDRN